MTDLAAVLADRDKNEEHNNENATSSSTYTVQDELKYSPKSTGYEPTANGNGVFRTSPRINNTRYSG